jgi:hypothetical protein
MITDTVNSTTIVWPMRERKNRSTVVFTPGGVLGEVASSIAQVSQGLARRCETPRSHRLLPAVRQLTRNSPVDRTRSRGPCGFSLGSAWPWRAIIFFGFFCIPRASRAGAGGADGRTMNRW